MGSAAGGAAAPYPLTALTVVLGPPRVASDAFADFQRAATAGEKVAEHPWAQHEYAALDALTAREGTIATHSLLETFVGGVLQVGVIAADVERQWVRHADGQLYASLTIVSEDVRPRAAGLAFHDPALVDALNAVGERIAALDDRVWIRWSSRTTHDVDDGTVLTRSAALMGQIAELVIRESPVSDANGNAETALEPELLTAIRLGRAHADAPGAPITRALRALRHHDPMRAEWTRILMDAFYLGALDAAQLVNRRDAAERQGLAFLYLGKERVDRLKANPDVSPRFRGEMAAKTFLTAYALERLAPAISAALCDYMAAT
ncbi:MAG: hypothetical protein K2R93_19130 [Gemmatimonadaceae bacterium]|nr:hypothetical protein [Gemmatimonadaceae bacterium]